MRQYVRIVRKCGSVVLKLFGFFGAVQPLFVRLLGFDMVRPIPDAEIWVAALGWSGSVVTRTSVLLVARAISASISASAG